MPELPEAETIVRDLRARLPAARRARRSRHARRRPAPGLTPAAARRARCAAARITGVIRRGKNVVSSSTAAAPRHQPRHDRPRGHERRAARRRAAPRRGHAAPRGRPRHALRRRPPLRRPRPARRTGWAERDAELGVEPLSDAFTAERLHALTRTSITPIRNWLLDQRRVAGVGNIYAIEALFRAGIRPTRRARTLRRRETAALRDALRAVLQESIDARGTTISDYRDGSGERGGFDRRLRVYDREGLPCVDVRHAIKRVVLSNRSAFYCPSLPALSAVR
jgi:formamidopyrimidine-DNA glycosylase